MQTSFKSIDEILSKYSSLRLNENKTRVICEWTGHEIPSNLNSILSYVNGNKYKQLLQKNIDNNKLKQMSDFLVPSKHPKRSNQLFCTLTLKHLNKQPDHIERHLKGKKFQKAHEHWLYCQENNIKFVPFSKQQSLSIKKNEDEENELENDHSDDSMSDLFPDELLDLVKDDHEDDDYEKVIDNKNHVETMEMGSDQEEGKIESTKATKKRSLDSKLNKKQKLEPQRKKKQSS